MKKAYSLDYSIERDVDRVEAVREILDSLDTDPNPTDLEQMGSYILYGKDADGYNAVQRGELTDNNKRFSSFKKKDDVNLSLDEILENPLADEQTFHPTYNRDHSIKKATTIVRTKYNKDGTIRDIGDGDIPGMQDYWDSIDRLEHRIAVAEGVVPPSENTTKPELSQYVIWQLKHLLIDLRRHQYYLKDSYKPTIHFIAIARPKTQYINWAEDSAYWIPLDEWREKVNNQLIKKYSTNLEDYETRADGTEVHWIVRRHVFDWENYLHIKAFINLYPILFNYLRDKLDTYGRTLFFDFDYYRNLANFTDVRNRILDLKIEGRDTKEIQEQIEAEFGIFYSETYLQQIENKEIPKAIALAATKHRYIVDTPIEDCKKCYACKQYLPRNKIFYTSNIGRKDHFSSICKDCERKRRIAKGEVKQYDGRRKDKKVLEVQAAKTNS